MIPRPVVPMRPLPERVVLAAFPTARRQQWPAPLPDERDGVVSFFVRADASQVGMPSELPPWLQLEGPHPVAPGLCRIDCISADNAVGEQRCRLRFEVRGRPYGLAVVQQPGLLVQTQMVRVLDTPLTVDVLVAVTFIARLIKDIPVPPVKLIVTLVAVMALVALGLAAALLRRLFAGVPEPRPLSTDTLGRAIVVFPGFSLSAGLPLKAFAAEDQLIALQTAKAVYWLLRQVE